MRVLKWCKPKETRPAPKTHPTNPFRLPHPLSHCPKVAAPFVAWAKTLPPIQSLAQCLYLSPLLRSVQNSGYRCCFHMIPARAMDRLPLGGVCRRASLQASPKTYSAALSQRTSNINTLRGETVQSRIVDLRRSDVISEQIQHTWMLHTVTGQSLSVRSQSHAQRRTTL